MMIELQSTNKSPTVIKDPPRPSAQFIPQKNQIETGKMISAPTIASNSSVTEQTPIVRPNQFSLLYKNEVSCSSHHGLTIPTDWNQYSIVSFID